MSSRTFGDVITRARRILQDTDDSNYRYPQSELVDAVNDALLEVRRCRPDLLMSSNFNPTFVAEGQVDATEIPIESHFFQTLVYLTAGYMMLRDDEFSLDSRAVNLLNKGVSQLLTTAS